MSDTKLRFPDTDAFKLEDLRRLWGSDLAEMYSERGIGEPLGIGNRPCLLVIDMARAFTDPGYRVGVNLDPVVARISELLNIFRELQLPIVYTNVAFAPNLKDAGMFGEKVPAVKELIESDPGVDIDPRLRPEPEDLVITKKFPSAFFMTHLTAFLTTENVDTIIHTGMSTSGCVRSSAIDAISHGYRSLVVQDAVGDRHPGVHWANLFDIDAKFADVVSARDVISELGNPAGDLIGD